MSEADRLRADLAELETRERAWQIAKAEAENILAMYAAMRQGLTAELEGHAMESKQCPKCGAGEVDGFGSNGPVYECWSHTAIDVEGREHFEQTFTCVQRCALLAACEAALADFETANLACQIAGLHQFTITPNQLRDAIALAKRDTEGDACK